MAGKFIVVEGIEGAGKSSAISVIQQQLAQASIDYVNTREPGGTPLAESLRTLVKSTSLAETVTQETELLLMYAARSQLVENVIQPALKKGKWVLGDRHDLSSQAYQGGGRMMSDEILSTLAQITLKGFTPDLTLLLDIEPSVGLSRASERGELDRIELEKVEFFERVRQKYLSLAEQNRSIIIIDASQPMADVHGKIADTVSEFIKRNR